MTDHRIIAGHQASSNVAPSFYLLPNLQVMIPLTCMYSRNLYLLCRFYMLENFFFQFENPLVEKFSSRLKFPTNFLLLLFLFLIRSCCIEHGT